MRTLREMSHGAQRAVSTQNSAPLPLAEIAARIGVANQRPRATDRANDRTAGPGSCRTQRNENDVPIVPARPESAPPVPLSECIAELAAALGLEVD